MNQVMFSGLTGMLYFQHNTSINQIKPPTAYNHNQTQVNCESCECQDCTPSSPTNTSPDKNQNLRLSNQQSKKDPTSKQYTLVHEWQQLSLELSRADKSKNYDTIIPKLQATSQKQTHPLAKFALLWLSDIYSLHGDHNRATKLLEILYDRYKHQIFGEKKWGAIALDTKKHILVRQGFDERAILIALQLCKEYPEAPDSFQNLMDLGYLYERTNQHKNAVQTYQKASTHPENTLNIPERQIAYIMLGGTWARTSLLELVDEVRSAFEAQDTEALRQLINPSIVYVGPGAGCMMSCKTEKLFQYLFPDLERSNKIVIAQEVLRDGEGPKAYLQLSNWNGNLIRGSLKLQFTYDLGRWCWNGLGGCLPLLQKLQEEYEPKENNHNPSTISAADGSYRTKFSNATIGSSTSALTSPQHLHLKAPWPKGISFRAGGLPEFVGISAGLMLPFPLNLPFIIAFSIKGASSCGYGPPGLYFNAPTTHLGENKYAIDFTRYWGTLINPLVGINTGSGVQVLAAAEGIVWRVFKETLSAGPLGVGDVTRTPKPKIPRGVFREANRVAIDHWDLPEGHGKKNLLLATLADLLSGFQHANFERFRKTVRYRTWYLHLEGGIANPKRPTVHRGQFVSQGEQLGFVDSTGMSFLPHLHFALHDISDTKATAAALPTPLDNQRLIGRDIGRCVHSTNMTKT